LINYGFEQPWERLMGYRDTVVQLNDYRQQIAGIKKQMRALQKQIEPEPVSDYVFTTLDGPVALSALFGDKQNLFIIHNMGKGCAHCTLWADGFNGVQHHLRDRAAFVVSSPDSPQVQQAFAASRNWLYPMVSHAGTSFAEDMGYRREGRFWPGISVFRKEHGQILRVSDTWFGPDDEFCVVWNFLDLLGIDSSGWRPRFSY
jgi:predicted dithiol-disulfide oxidoreductase (DUF899 family)